MNTQTKITYAWLALGIIFGVIGLLEFDEMHCGIKGISFQNDSCKTAFMLKYNT